MKTEIPEVDNPNDGLIFVPVEQFVQDYRAMYVNYNASKMKFDYFLKLNDSDKTYPSDIRESGLKVSKKMKLAGHKLKIVSPVA